MTHARNAWSLLNGAQDKLETLASISGAKADLKRPSSPKYNAPELGLVQVGLDEPSLLWGVPTKSAGYSSSQIAIAFTGRFIFRDDELLQTDAAMVIFEIRRSGGTSMEAVDAFHFDSERMPGSPFHPAFHVQRNVDKRIRDANLAERWRRLSGLGDRLSVPDHIARPPSRCVRIPTPQMDCCALMVSLAADFFCSDNPTPNARTVFSELLLSLRTESAGHRNGTTAKALHERIKAIQGLSPLCPTHWYSESQARR